MIPFNLLITRNPRPTIREPNPLRASGPYYHICYVRCAISNLRPPNCFYNTSPVHPRFLLPLSLSLSLSLSCSFSSALSTSLKRSFDRQGNMDVASICCFEPFPRDSTRTFAATINFIQLIARGVSQHCASLPRANNN